MWCCWRIVVLCLVNFYRRSWWLLSCRLVSLVVRLRSCSMRIVYFFLIFSVVILFFVRVCGLCWRWMLRLGILFSVCLFFWVRYMSFMWFDFVELGRLRCCLG